jgi:all-trans-retinol 13,14-reductase
MSTTRTGAGADVVVVGSGVGGLAAAAALARCGRRVQLLERHLTPGGSTQTFGRGGFRFAAGLHYVGGAADAPGLDGHFGRLASWLSDGQLRFVPVGSPYDVVRFPGFEFPIEAPRAAYVARLKATFPGDAEAIDGYFAAADRAVRATTVLFAAKALPTPVASLVRCLTGRGVRRALGSTTAQALRAIRDPRLAALLAARWPDHGLPPARAPFPLHALVMGSYAAGAYYPVGGPASFAAQLGAAITAAGGTIRTSAPVVEIMVAAGKVAGVRLASGETIATPVVVSAMGARNTATALTPGAAPAWRDAVQSLRSSISYVNLYLGLRGDIGAHGATSANVWIHEGDDVAAVWEPPWTAAAPGLFVSFPSLKDPDRRAPGRHTAEVIALCRWAPFAAWAESAPGQRPAAYAALKARLGVALLAQFGRHFPALAPLVAFHEVATPLSQASFVGAHEGAMYGLEATAERLLHPVLRVRTPIHGLLLAGQDVISPGVQGAFMGGVLAAAALEPRLWRHVSRTWRGDA